MKKNSLGLIVLLLGVVRLFSLSPQAHFLPTESGTYVYYRDYSFETETYIGFLYYDDNTYGLRFVSLNPPPSSNEQNTQPYSTVEVLISVDEKDGQLEMSGERIIGEVTSEDASKLNYLHDLLYLLYAKRSIIKSSDFTRPEHSFLSSAISQNETIPLFGGDVTILYDFVIPIFNVESICALDTKKQLFVAIATGKLHASDDTAFSNFFGFPASDDIGKTNVQNQKKCTGNLTTVLPLKSNTEVYNSSMGEKEFTQIEADWQQVAGNLLLLGSNGLLYRDSIVTDKKMFENVPYNIYEYMTARFLSGDGDGLYFLPSRTFYAYNDTLILFSLLYNPVIKRFVYDTKILAPKKDNTYEITALTFFYDFYKHNKAYVNTKIKSLISK